MLGKLNTYTTTVLDLVHPSVKEQKHFQTKVESGLAEQRGNEMYKHRLREHF